MTSSEVLASEVFTSEAFKALYATIVKLRSPDGCKWDREQTPSSLRGALVEETYECLEAIDENDPAHIAEELGDLFLLAAMIGYMHEQDGKFSVADTLKGINEKLIRRHPHVFGDVKIKDTAEILDNWAAIKVQEGRKPKDSILDEVSSGLPPMDRAYALQKKAAKAGFDWPDTEGVIAKIKEELNEVQLAMNKEHNVQAIEEELGDLLFSVINLCRFLKMEPSVVLRRTNSKFTERFKYVEKKMKETGQEMKQENLDIMENYWNEAKK
jgi:tetrapyrrole methylase family protein/MazG family protein